jgi:hypothetical protein
VQLGRLAVRQDLDLNDASDVYSAENVRPHMSGGEDFCACHQSFSRGTHLSPPDHDIVARLDRAADAAPEEIAALLLEAADMIRMLRELVDGQDEDWFERVEPKGRA